MNKVVVITGGASGIGLAIAQSFAAAGAKVAIFGRDADKLNHAQTVLQKSMAVQGDVRKIKDLDRLFEQTHNTFGKIDIIIANAGIAARRAVSNVDEQFFDDIVDTN
ncbi:MAG TPA: SDR family NAD(P)-dependent oxidoreductase, partial [Gammaproteobacteria bacterium]|nr:SDR family NAD(P)-dependent oxidoreductase [Gammaproteobacteria bacterium]